MERACDILVTFTKENENTLKQLKNICDRVVLHTLFEEDDDSSIAVEAEGIVWTSTVNADFVDEDDVKDTLNTEFDNEEVTNVKFVYYDFELDDKIDFATETGEIFEDYDEQYIETENDD